MTKRIVEMAHKNAVINIFVSPGQVANAEYHGWYRIDADEDRKISKTVRGKKDGKSNR